MPLSLHSHSGEFCMHARGTLEQCINQAVKMGFHTFALTEHVPRYRIRDLYPEENHLQPSDLLTTFNTYLNQAHDLRRFYAKKHPSLNLLVGCETEYIRKGSISKLVNLLETHKESIHFFVGSVHHVRSIPIDFNRNIFTGPLVRAIEDDLDPMDTLELNLFPENPTKKNSSSSDSESKSITNEIPMETLEKIFIEYFEAQYQLIKTLNPMVIGHFDLIRLYCEDVKFHDYPDVWKLISRNIDEVITYGGLFEINASAFRKGWKSAYPQKDILDLIISKNGRLTISDDSHAPESIGKDYAKLYKYMRDNNVSKLWYLEVDDFAKSTGGKNMQNVIAKELEGDWWEHRFWKDIL